MNDHFKFIPFVFVTFAVIHIIADSFAPHEDYFDHHYLHDIEEEGCYLIKQKCILKRELFSFDNFFKQKFGKWKEFVKSSNFPNSISLQNETEFQDVSRAGWLYNINMTMRGAKTKETSNFNVTSNCVRVRMEIPKMLATFTFSNITLEGEYEANGSLLNGKYQFKTTGAWTSSLTMQCSIIAQFNVTDENKFIGSIGSIYCFLENAIHRYDGLLKDVEMKSVAEKEATAMKKIVVNSFEESLNYPGSDYYSFLRFGNIYKNLHKEIKMKLGLFVGKAIEEEKDIFAMTTFGPAQ